MASNRLILSLLAGLALTGAVFWLFPALDLLVAGWFYRVGEGFPFGKTLLAEIVRRGIWGASGAMVALALILGAVAVVRGKPLWGTRGRLWAFILLLYAIGPGIVVEWGLKGHWGRARPHAVSEFGGQSLFTPVWEVSDQCLTNCSFSGGEASGATALAISLWLLLAALGPRIGTSTRRIGQGIALAAPLLVSLQRLVVGAHFLSDIVTSWFLVALIACLLSRLVPPLGRQKPSTFNPAAPPP